MDVSDGQIEIYISDIFCETIIARDGRANLDHLLTKHCWSPTDEFLLEPLVHILRCDKTEFLFKSLIPFVHIEFN